MAPRTAPGRAATAPPLVASVPGVFPVSEPLTGCGREQAHLEKTLHDARGGRSAVIGIHGLSGSGKTLLVETTIAEATGFTVVRLPGDRGPDPVDTLWQEVFQFAEDAARSEGAGGGAPDATADRLHELIVAALRATYGRAFSPALLVLDDCRAEHKELAEAIARTVLDPESGIAAVMVLTWRDLPEGTTLSFDRSGFPVHALQPLTLEQSAEHLAQRIGKLPDPSVLAELWRATGGNPSALLSTCSQLTDEELDGLVPLPDPVPIGSDLAEAFGSWAESLQGDAVIALTVAATASMTRPVLEDALAHLDLSLEALRPATELGALAVLGDRVQFAHPLCRAAVFQRSSASSARAARAAVVHAFRRSGQPERAAVHAALSSGNRDDTVATLCTQAAQNASQRSDPETAARYEMLGAQFAQNRQRSAQHLIRAAALWQAAGRPERAMECIRRVTPVTPSEAILGQATYRAARIAFATDASAETPAQMAAGAEACVSEGLDDAVAMLADAAASAMLTDQVDEALQYARRAAELAGTGTRNAGVAARSILDAVANLASAEGVSPEQRDTVVGVMNGVELYTGSPQLAYVLGAAHVQVAAPALVGRWFSWMLASSGTALNRPLPAVVAMVRAKERLDAGDVHEAVSAAENAVSQLEELHDRPLLARALGWCAWAQASAGQVGRVFETATKFFALEPASAHTARLQVLVSLAHCELQRGHVDRATAWLRAVEDESVTRDGYQGCADWPLLSIFLLLCLLADYEPKRMHGDTTAPVSGTAGHWPRMVAWSEAMLQTDPAASLNHLEEIEAGSPRAPMVNAADQTDLGVAAAQARLDCGRRLQLHAGEHRVRTMWRRRLAGVGGHVPGARRGAWRRGAAAAGGRDDQRGLAPHARLL